LSRKLESDHTPQNGVITEGCIEVRTVMLVVTVELVQMEQVWNRWRGLQ